MGRNKLSALILVTLLAFVVPARAQQVTTSGSVGTASGGTGVSYGAPQTSLLTAASGTYTTPTGALWLKVCVFGAGGGGGGAQTGGAAAHGGGQGATGGTICMAIPSPVASYSYTNGTGGTAGACNAGAANTGGNATGTAQFGTTQGIQANQGSGGGAATTTTDGAAGAAGGAQGNGSYTFTANAGIIANYTSVGGAAGSAGTAFPNQVGEGACGGRNATVSAAGACVQAANAGCNGYITVEAYFN